MACLEEFTLQRTRLYVCHQIHPQGNLRTVQRCLFHKTLGAVARIGNGHLVGLVSRITQEVALKHSHRSLKLSLNQLLVRIHQRIQLVVESQTAVRYVQYSVIFFYPFAAIKGKEVCIGVCVVDMLYHRFLFLLRCKGTNKRAKCKRKTRFSFHFRAEVP